MESYSFEEGDDVTIDVRSSVVISDEWVELVLTRNGDITSGIHTYIHTYINTYIHSGPLQAHTLWCSLEDSLLQSPFHSRLYLLMAYSLACGISHSDSGILIWAEFPSHVGKLHSP